MAINKDNLYLFITTVVALDGRGRQHSLVDHHSNALPVFSEAFLLPKVNYIHLNPVREGLAERAEEYRWSSARQWLHKLAEEELLRMDLERLDWRRPR
jgi:hypothetical protein